MSASDMIGSLFSAQFHDAMPCFDMPCYDQDDMLCFDVAMLEINLLYHAVAMLVDSMMLV